MARESVNKNDDVMELLNSLDKDTGISRSTTPKPRNDKKGGSTKNDDEDIMGFLDSLTKSGVNSGKSTPALKSSETFESTTSLAPATESSDANQPLPQSDDATDNEYSSGTNEEQIQVDPISSISSWWSKNKGGIWNSATSAVKQAEAKVRELQLQQAAQNQQAIIDNLGDSLSKFSLNRDFLKSTLSSVLDTIVPPISRHEQLKIHIFHDMVGYPSIDSIVYTVFDRVMRQVEGGGDLTMVVQKGKERVRRGSDVNVQKDLNMFKGDVEQAKRLAAANIEDYIHSTMKEKAETEQTPVMQEFIGATEESEKVVRISDIYLSIQAAAFEKSDKDEKDSHDSTLITAMNPSTFYFLVYLSDAEHDINFSTVSQAFPYQWVEWVESSNETFKGFNADPRDWVIDWIEEGLRLAVGTVAQSYVAKRMGIELMFDQRQ